MNTVGTTDSSPVRVYCRGCGYDLRTQFAGTPPRCPECGRAFSPDDPKSYATRPPRSLLRLCLQRSAVLVPFVVPFVFHMLYKPYNRAWTVKRFGCGCPPLSAHKDAWRFNANDFNLILWAVLAIACGAAWWALLRREFPDPKPRGYLWAQVCGLMVLLFICLSRYAAEWWL